MDKLYGLIQHHNRREQNLKDLLNKKFRDIVKFVEKSKYFPRRTMALFRLKIGHYCLDDHLHRIGITPIAGECSLWGENILLGKEHFLHCRWSDPEKKNRKDIAGLYWEARGLMVWTKLQPFATTITTFHYHTGYILVPKVPSSPISCT